MVIYPTKILREKMPEVSRVDKKLVDNIGQMSRFLKGAENGAGLAAPQMGIKQRFFVLKDHEGRGKISVFINPKVEKTYGAEVFPEMVSRDGERQDFLEGCLSFPDYWGTVKRFLKIDAVWQDEIGGQLVARKKKLEGFDAVVFQHELDHLNGVLFVDRVKTDKGKFYKWLGGKMIKWDVDEVIKGKV